MLAIESGKRGTTLHVLIAAAAARDHGRGEGFSRRPNAARGSLRIVGTREALPTGTDEVWADESCHKGRARRPLVRPLQRRVPDG